MDGGANRGEERRLGAGAKARNAELVRQLARAIGNRLAHLLGLEQDRKSVV